MSDPLVELQMNNGVARLTLNRADRRNALSKELITQLTAAVETVANDAGVRLLILTGAGSVFCAGMDLGEMQERAGHPNARELWQQDTHAYHDLLAALLQLRIPTLAVVQGPALAGGMGLLLACDMVLAADEAFFALPEPKRGITAAVVAPLLVYRIGPGRATYLLLSGENVTAAEALGIGLCHEVTSRDLLDERTAALTGSILSGAPAALARTKQHVMETAGAALFEHLQVGMQVSAEARETDDAREGLAAFLEKRRPSWPPNDPS